jgi:hypothetical protein
MFALSEHGLDATTLDDAWQQQPAEAAAGAERYVLDGRCGINKGTMGALCRAVHAVLQTLQYMI